jgi:hypothetical protein
VGGPFPHVGTDILGQSDSIVAGSDTYTSHTQRTLTSTIVDSGTPASPCYLTAWASDQFTLNDTGTSTLTSTGHVYATDTITYVENTSDAASASLSSNGPSSASVAWGAATDSYANADTMTQTVADGVTTSIDNFNLTNSHWIYGSCTQSPRRKTKGPATFSTRYWTDDPFV